MDSMKRLKDMMPEDEHPSPGHKMSNMLLGKREGQLLGASERMR